MSHPHESAPDSSVEKFELTDLVTLQNVVGRLAAVTRKLVEAGNRLTAVYREFPNGDGYLAMQEFSGVERACHEGRYVLDQLKKTEKLEARERISTRLCNVACLVDEAIHQGEIPESLSRELCDAVDDHYVGEELDRNRRRRVETD